jgi:hypothetical protein
VDPRFGHPADSAARGNACPRRTLGARHGLGRPLTSLPASQRRVLELRCLKSVGAVPQGTSKSRFERLRTPTESQGLRAPPEMQVIHPELYGELWRQEHAELMSKVARRHEAREVSQSRFGERRRASRRQQSSIGRPSRVAFLFPRRRHSSIALPIDCNE